MVILEYPITTRSWYLLQLFFPLSRNLPKKKMVDNCAKYGTAALRPTMKLDAFSNVNKEIGRTVKTKEMLKRIAKCEANKKTMLFLIFFPPFLARSNSLLIHGL